MVMSGLGSMGSGIGAALGAKLALPERPVVAICGDGGLAMTAGELATAAAEKLGVLFFVLNDQRLGMVELGLDALYGRSGRHSTVPLNVPTLASALGAQSVVVERPGDIVGMHLPARLRRGPLVVDVHIDRSVRMNKNGRFAALAAITRRPRLVR
jgi:acetolactate synthase-1/2/3 large subunit